MASHYSLFNEVNSMLNRAICSLIVPVGSVLFRSINFTPLTDYDVYECVVVLKKGSLLRRYDLDIFEFELKDDNTIINHGVWVSCTDKGLELRINVIDNYKKIML